MNASALGRAAFQPLALVVLLAAIASGAMVSWWLLPLGLVVYVLMVALAARDPLMRIAPIPSVPRQQLTSPTFRGYLESIERTAVEIQRSVARAPGSLGTLLAKIGEQARDLTQEARTLCDKGQIIEQYLANVNQGALQKQVEALDIRLRSTNDPYTRDQLSETRQALAERQQNAHDLETYIGRITAQLQNIGANLENVLAETVRLRTADAVSADVATSGVAQRLADLKADMDAFQQVLDTAITHTSATP